MPTLDRRVQVLFDPEEYDRLAAWARRQSRSVGSVIRESVWATLAGQASVRQGALERLLTRSDAATPQPVGDWDAVKDSFDRDSLAVIE